MPLRPWLFASLLALGGCQLPQVQPLEGTDNTALAMALHERIRAEGIAPASVDTVLGGTSAFPNVNEYVGRLLQRLARTDPMDRDERDATLRELGSELRRASDYSSAVRFCTAQPGARVLYRLVQDDRQYAVPELTNTARPYPIVVGIYHIWSERNGKPTSSPDMQFFIVNKSGGSVALDEAGSGSARCP